MSRRSIMAPIVGFSLVSLLIFGGVAAAQTGKASVDGTVQADVQAAANMAVAKGISVSGYRLKEGKTEDYLVGDTLVNGGGGAPNAAELKDLKAVMDVVEGLPAMNNAAMRNAAFTKAANTIATAAGKFPLRNKKNSAIDTGLLKGSAGGVGGHEKATARASQIILNNKYDTKGTIATTDVKAGNVFKNPHASAFAFNRDPISVEWLSSSSRLEIDLSGVSLAAQTSLDPGATAWTSFFFSGRFVNDTLDVDTTLPADPLFEMTLSLFTSEGSTPTLDLVSFTGFGNTVYDSLTGTDSASVQNNLTTLFSYNAVDDLFELSDSSYRIYVDMPNDPSESVLYLDQYGAAVSLAAVPEASTVVLAGFGALLGFAALRMSHKPVRK